MDYHEWEKWAMDYREWEKWAMDYHGREKTSNGLSLKEVGKYKPIYFFGIFVCSHSYTASWVNWLTAGSSFQNVILFSCGIDSKCDIYIWKWPDTMNMWSVLMDTDVKYSGHICTHVFPALSGLKMLEIVALLQASIIYPWWHHQMETFSMLLALCAGNSLVTDEFPSQRPLTQSFDVFFDLCLNKRLSKQMRCWWFETPLGSSWCHCNATHLMYNEWPMSWWLEMSWCQIGTRPSATIMLIWPCLTTHKSCHEVYIFKIPLETFIYH